MKEDRQENEPERKAHDDGNEGRQQKGLAGLLCGDRDGARTIGSAVIKGRELAIGIDEGLHQRKELAAFVAGFVGPFQAAGA